MAAQKPEQKPRTANDGNSPSRVGDASASGEGHTGFFHGNAPTFLPTYLQKKTLGSGGEAPPGRSKSEDLALKTLGSGGEALHAVCRRGNSGWNELSVKQLTTPAVFKGQWPAVAQHLPWAWPSRAVASKQFPFFGRERRGLGMRSQ